jgi:hypothetical protein
MQKKASIGLTLRPLRFIVGCMEKNNNLTHSKSVTVQLVDGEFLTFKNVREVTEEDPAHYKIVGDDFTYVVCQKVVTRITTTEDIVNGANAYQPIDYDDAPVLPEEVFCKAFDAWKEGDVGTAISLVVRHTGFDECWAARWLTRTWGPESFNY